MKNIRKFFIINVPSRSNMSAKIAIYEIQNGNLVNLTGHYNKKDIWQTFIVVSGYGFDRVNYYITKNIIKNKEPFDYTILNSDL